jgi:mRNA-degrading endonuclease RelE of RelBE toxin-antitoxin system
MAYQVTIKRKIGRKLLKLPEDIKKLFFLLVEDLKDEGPYQLSWPNYSPLGEDRYHCHLKHSWVACWQWAKDTIEIEVYYVGSRSKAPY